MKKPVFLTLALFGVIFAFPFISYSQQDFDVKIREVRQLVDTSYNNRIIANNGSKKKSDKYSYFVTGYLLDSLIRDNQKALSGSQIEAGKSFATSLSIDDEGATANISFGKFGRLNPQLTISGKGKEKFINIFKDGKYSQSITGGFNLNYFLNSSGFFDGRNKSMLLPEIVPYINKAFKNSKSDNIQQSAYEEQVKNVQEKLSLLKTNFDSYKKSWQEEVFDDKVFQGAKDFEKNANDLIKLGILKDDFLKKVRNEFNTENYFTKLEAKIDSNILNWTSEKKEAANNYRKRLLLKDIDSIQMKAKWNEISYRWFTFSGNYNISPYSILDTSDGAAERSYKKTENDKYFSGKIAYNYLRVNSENLNRRYYSITGNVSNARQYDPDGMITLESSSPYPIGSVNLSKENFSTEVYENIAPHKFSANMQLTMIHFWSKTNIGIELTPKVGFNDINNDNVGMRIGVFIPVEVKDGVPLTIQPICKLQKLFESSKYKFWKDNVVFGFNLSVSLPTIPNKKDK